MNNVASSYVCNVPGVRMLDGFEWTRGACADYDAIPTKGGTVTDKLHHSKATFYHVATFLRHECAEWDSAG